MNSNLAFQESPREELIGGKLVAMSPRPFPNHNRVAENIDFIFRLYLRGKTCVPLGDGYDLYLTEQDRFVPDFMIVCDRGKIKYNGVHGAPDLVVEVLSRGTTANDRWHKKEAYERSGVPEYWIVSAQEETIEVYLLQEGSYILDNIYTYYPAEDLADMKPEERAAVATAFKCHLYDDLLIHLDDIFGDLF